LSHIRRAVELDPLNLQYNSNLGQILCNAHQYEECIDQLKKTLDMDVNFAYAHNMLRVAYRDTGKYDLSLEQWRKSATLANDQDDLAIAEEVGKVYAKSGLKASVEREIELRKQLAKHRYVDPAEIAYAYAFLGDKEQSFAWLDKARVEKSGALENIKIIRPLQQWHSDPRYSALLKQLGLPQ
jgi:tetratricopeptide (TPR) repeat protein